MTACAYHELKTSINVIQNSLTCLKSIVQDSRALNFINICQSSNAMQNCLTLDAIDYTTLRTGNLRLNNELVDIRGTIFLVKEMMNVQILMKKNVKFNCTIDPSVA